jgi:hypothetical protein
MLLHDNHLSVQTVAKEISFKQMARGVILATTVVVLVEVVLQIVILKPGQVWTHTASKCYKCYDNPLFLPLPPR